MKTLYVLTLLVLLASCKGEQETCINGHIHHRWNGDTFWRPTSSRCVKSVINNECINGHE